jgi:hypothetical protein
MRIFFDTNPADGSVRFYHEAHDGPRQLPTWKNEAERQAGKRPVMVDNAASRIPAGATEISPARFEELMAAQAGGAVIVLRGGKPVATPRVLSEEEHRAAIRRERDRRLAASDWTQLPDSPLSDEQRAEWAAYRQALRDLDMGGGRWPKSPADEGTV